MPISEVFNVDCLKYMKGLPDNYFDIAVADPPYGIGADKPAKKPSVVRQPNGTYLRVNAPDYGKKDWDVLPKKRFFKELFRVSKHQIIFGANYFGLIGGMLVWDKMNGSSDQYGCEIAYQSFSQRTDIVHYMWAGMFQGETCSVDVNIANRQKGNKAFNEERIHPCQKPVALYAWILKNYAKKGDKVFDPMMGSGSSRIAAYKLGFDFTGCEVDEEYYVKSRERFNRECMGIHKTKSGKTVIEQNLF